VKPHQGVGNLKQLWQTRLMYLNIAAMLSPDDVPKFNSKLASAILFEYKNFKQKQQNPSPGSTNQKTDLVVDGSNIPGGKDLDVLFRDWQIKSGGKHLKAYQEFGILEEFLQGAIDKYLSEIGMKKEQIQARSTKLDIWATVHHGLMAEEAHIAPNSLVSGIYYVKTGEFTGSILFDDPRGPLPPFDNKLTIKPYIGDMFLFPGWLMYQLSRTPSNEQRITISFSLPGDWTSTVKVAETFPVKS